MSKDRKITHAIVEQRITYFSGEDKVLDTLGKSITVSCEENEVGIKKLTSLLSRAAARELIRAFLGGAGRGLGRL